MTSDAVSVAAADAAASRREASPAPLFVAGPDRSGTTLMFALLASHPDVSMVRRTNMWRYFHRRYGDLADVRNLDRCVEDMVRYRRMRHLHPDPERIRREFLAAAPTYGRLFALFHEHHAQRNGKARWGDKSLHTEHYADRVLGEFPDARIIHMVRDPRDRYASVRKRYGQDLSRVAAATGRWLLSTRAGLRARARHPDRYLIVRYEDLVRDPEATVREVCAFAELSYHEAMLTMAGAPEHRDSGGNSSFGDLEPGAVSTRAVGRFRTALSPSEVAFIELVAARAMAALGYERSKLDRPVRERLRFALTDLPVELPRMIGWMTLTQLRRRRGEKVSAPRSAPAPRL